MSQDRAEDRFDRSEDSQIDKQKISEEVAGGREELVKKDHEKIAELKNGGSSGITAEFGKPEIEMDDRYPHFPDLLPADARAAQLDSRSAQDTAKDEIPASVDSQFTSRPQLPVEDNRGAAIPEQVPGSGGGPHMTPVPWSRQDEIRRRQNPDKNAVEAMFQTIDKEEILMRDGWMPHPQVLRQPPTQQHRRR